MRLSVGKSKYTGSRILRQAYNQVKNAVSHTHYKLRKMYYANKIEQHKDGLKNTWEALKQAIGHTNKSIQIEKNDDGTKVVTINAKIADAFCFNRWKISREISPVEMSPSGHIPVTNATVQAICNITNFLCKKIIRIRTNFVHKFVYDISEKVFHDFAHEFMPEKEFVHEFMSKYYIFKERI